MPEPTGCRILPVCGRRACLGLALVLLAMVGWAASTSAVEPNRAGLAVLFEDGSLVSRCVEFEGDAIAGSEMLARSGLEVLIDATHGGGITVCKIAGTGCDYPVDACFCQCMGNGPCQYWNYYYRQPGQAEWVYSTLGALAHESVPGSMEAWVWGDGHTPPGQELTFESVCAPPPTPTPVPTWTALPLPEAASTPAPTHRAAEETAVPTATPLPVEGTGEPASPAGGTEGGEAGWRSYWPFGLMLLMLAAAAAYLRAGRRV